MCWCKYRLLVLGLLLLIVHINCDTCGTKFTDIQSSAVIADVIFEGMVTGDIPAETNQRYNVTVKVQKIHKGKGHLINEKKEKIRKVTIGDFGRKDELLCLTPIEGRIKYIFFLRNTSSNVYYNVSALPVQHNKKSMRKVRKMLCKTCAKLPKIKPIKDQKKKEGQKLKIKCSAKAKPRAIKYTWYKDGVKLERRKGLSIKSGKRGSRLQIIKLSSSDAGQYRCEAENVVGKTNLTVRLEVKGAVINDYLLCEKQSYCLNGGTCRQLPSLNETFCQCPLEWAGSRCELWDYKNLERESKLQAKILHDRTLIIIGIVISVLVFIIICVVSHFLSKRQRKKWEKRKQAKLNKNIPDTMSVPLLDDVDGRHPARLTSAAPPIVRPTVHETTQTGTSLTQIFPAIEPRVETTSLVHAPVLINGVARENAIQLNNVPAPHNRNRAARGSRSRLKAVSVDEAKEDEAKKPPRDVPVRSQSQPDHIRNVSLYDRKPEAIEENEVTMQNPELFSVGVEGDRDVEEMDYPRNDKEDPMAVVSNGFPSPPGIIDVHNMDDFPEEVPSPMSDPSRNPLLPFSMSDSDSDSGDDQSPLPVLYISEEDLRTSSDDLQTLEGDSGNVNDTLSDQEFPQSKSENRHPFLNGRDSDAGSRASNSSESATSSSAASVRSPSYIMYNSYQDPDAPTRAWDEQGTPVSDHFAYNSIPNSDSNMIEDQFMHKPSVSPSKTENKYNVYKKLKDIRDDQDAIPI